MFGANSIIKKKSPSTQLHHSAPRVTPGTFGGRRLLEND